MNLCLAPAVCTDCWNFAHKCDWYLGLGLYESFKTHPMCRIFTFHPKRKWVIKKVRPSQALLELMFCLDWRNPFCFSQEQDSNLVDMGKLICVHSFVPPPSYLMHSPFPYLLPYTSTSATSFMILIPMPFHWERSCLVVIKDGQELLSISERIFRNSTRGYPRMMPAKNSLTAIADGGGVGRESQQQ